jgi:hypothetical protein
MVKFVGIILVIILGSTSLAFAQVPNTNPGGPIVPKGNDTMQQYCWYGTCQTPNTILNGTISANDSSHNELRSQYNIIMIIPSELCTRAIEHHVKTDCPTLHSLMKYDNSNQHISGYFYPNILDNTWSRSDPQVKNHWQYYGYTNHTIVCVYCTGNYLTTDLYKTIILEPVSFEYAPHNFTSEPYNVPEYNSTYGNFTNVLYQQNEIDAGLTTFLNRQVTGCNTATIAYSDLLLNDTIKYLESGCTKTNYNMTNTQKVPNSPWEYSNPFSSLHYLSALKQMTDGYGIYGYNGTKGGHGPGNCINGCSYTTSTRKAGY